MAARTMRTGRIFSPYEIVHSDVDISVLVAKAIANAEDDGDGDDPIQGFEGDSLSSEESENDVVDQGPPPPTALMDSAPILPSLALSTPLPLGTNSFIISSSSPPPSDGMDGVDDASKDSFGEGIHSNIQKHATSIAAFKMDVQLESLPIAKGVAPFALLDCYPNDPSWDSVVEGANKAMKKAAVASEFKPHQVKHR
ncbi:hypothetical protein C8Q78DRAFT_992213 [Trametes maxima]|nr:hypothetical protein C8Q78DRAFT_992213 [Trametes maxima]